MISIVHFTSNICFRVYDTESMVVHTKHKHWTEIGLDTGKCLKFESLRVNEYLFYRLLKTQGPIPGRTL